MCWCREPLVILSKILRSFIVPSNVPINQGVVILQRPVGTRIDKFTCLRKRHWLAIKQRILDLRIQHHFVKPRPGEKNCSYHLWHPVVPGEENVRLVDPKARGDEVIASDLDVRDLLICTVDVVRLWNRPIFCDPDLIGRCKYSR